MARHYDPIDRPDGGLCRDRAPVNCEGVPTLPDTILERIKNKQEPTLEEQELVKQIVVRAQRSGYLSDDARDLVQDLEHVLRS